MTEQQQSYFEGFAILEIFGHQKYAGFVKTEYYGTACMFRCDIPPLPELEKVTRAGCYVDVEGGQSWVPGGSTVKKPATKGYSKLFGAPAVFSMTPCDQESCLAAVAELQPRELMLVKLPEGKALAATEPIGYTCCGGNPEDGHNLGCAVFDEHEEDEDEDDSECPVCLKVHCTCPTT